MFDPRLDELLNFIAQASHEMLTVVNNTSKVIEGVHHHHNFHSVSLRKKFIKVSSTSLWVIL